MPFNAMKLMLAGVTTLGFLTMAGCGPDETLVKSALNHRCNMTKAMKDVDAAKTPADKAKAMKQVKESQQFLDAILSMDDGPKIREELKNRTCP